jgi:predicted dehydrogenase
MYGEQYRLFCRAAMIYLGILSTARINIDAIIKPAKKNPRCQLLAIASRDLARAKQYAKSHDQIPKAYGDYQDLLNDPCIDAVYISTPNALHEHWLEKAIMAGKHVLCEKPLVTSANKLNYLVNLATEKNVFFMEAMHYQYHPALKDFFNLIDKKIIGTIHEVNVFLRYYYPDAVNDIRLSRELKGGSFMHLGCYCLDAITRIIGHPLAYKTFQVLKQTDEVDLTCTADLETSDGKIKASIYCDYSSHVFDSGIEIKGEKGYLHLKSALNPTNFSHQDFNDTAILETNLTQPLILSSGNGLSTYDYQLNYFIDRIQKKNFTPQVNQKAYILLIQGAKIIMVP